MIVWPQVKQQGTQPRPSTENWIKDLLSTAPPIRIRLSFLLSGSDGKASACNVGDPGSIPPPLGWEGPLEKEMAIHSSTLAWKIPWMEAPGGLQSMGLQRVGHD